MISLKQLRHALAVEKHLHFRKAAESCSVSQSALSTSLSTLEQQLGVVIFERDNKKVLVTPIGAEILQKAREIQLHVDDMEKLAESQSSVLSYPITVGIIPTICPYILPIVLPSLRAQYPDFNIKVIEETSSELVDKVRSGEIDTAILALPYPTEGLLSFEFWKEDFFWITHQDEMPHKKTEITAKDLGNANLMLLKDGHCLKDHALSACGFQGTNSHSLSATSLSTLIQLVIAKSGTTLIPEMALSQLIGADSPLSAIKLAEKGPHRGIAFIVRPNYVGTKNIETLMKVFTQSLKEHFSRD